MSCLIIPLMAILRMKCTLIHFLSLILCVSFTKAYGPSLQRITQFHKLKYQSGSPATILKTVPAKTSIQCSLGCLEDSNCATVTFDKATGMCDLLPTKATPSGIPTSVVAYSMDDQIPTCGIADTVYKHVYVGTAGLTRCVCDNGWIVIQNRDKGGVNFKQNYQTYIDGFGDLSGDFWWGLEHLHALTAIRPYKLRVEMTMRGSGNFYWENYSSFEVKSKANHYELSVSGPSGNASDAMVFSHGMKFSAFDHEKDLTSTLNCADTLSSGWWFNNCFGRNGTNLNGPHGQCEGWKGLSCILWRPIDSKPPVGLLKARMMIKL